MNRKADVWLVIMAGGLSTRMKKQKLLLRIFEESMLRYVVKTGLSTKADGVVVVVNGNCSALAKEIADLDVVVIENKHAKSGMSSSLKLGIGWLLKRKVSAAVVLLADQPGVTATTINNVIENYQLSKPNIIRTMYQDHPSHPVLFANSLFPEILNITGDIGAKPVLQKYKDQVSWLHVDTLAPPDIDTEEDYRGACHHPNFVE